jgi:hypothetical protein
LHPSASKPSIPTYSFSTFSSLPKARRFQQPSAPEALNNPPYTAEEYLARLAANGLVGAASALKEFSVVI